MARNPNVCNVCENGDSFFALPNSTLDLLEYGETVEGTGFVVYGVSMNGRQVNGCWFLYTRKTLLELAKYFRPTIKDKDTFDNFVEKAFEKLPNEAPTSHSRSYNREKEFSWRNLSTEKSFHS